MQLEAIMLDSKAPDRQPSRAGTVPSVSASSLCLTQNYPINKNWNKATLLPFIFWCSWCIKKRNAKTGLQKCFLDILNLYLQSSFIVLSQDKGVWEQYLIVMGVLNNLSTFDLANIKDVLRQWWILLRIFPCIFSWGVYVQIRTPVYTNQITNTLDRKEFKTKNMLQI